MAVVIGYQLGAQRGNLLLLQQVVPDPLRLLLIGNEIRQYSFFLVLK